MTVVYIWTKSDNSWGHASLEVDDVYISWWPTDSKSKNSLKSKKVLFSDICVDKPELRIRQIIDY